MALYDISTIKEKEAIDLKQFNYMKTQIEGYKIYDAKTHEPIEYIEPLVFDFNEIKKEKIILMIYTKDLKNGIRGISRFSLCRDLNIKEGNNLSFIKEFNNKKTRFGLFLKHLGFYDKKRLDFLDDLVGKEVKVVAKKFNNRETLEIYYEKS